MPTIPSFTPSKAASTFFPSSHVGITTANVSAISTRRRSDRVHTLRLASLSFLPSIPPPLPASGPSRQRAMRSQAVRTSSWMDAFLPYVASASPSEYDGSLSRDRHEPSLPWHASTRRARRTWWLPTRQTRRHERGSRSTRCGTAGRHTRIGGGTAATKAFVKQARRRGVERTFHVADGRRHGGSERRSTVLPVRAGSSGASHLDPAVQEVLGRRGVAHVHVHRRTKDARPW
mmetsp:Transcript_3250/g.20200  ORF Transcript_3250/g.20200 Transcript_3250/m.20200 type:complete len:232 (+) Transcript_3250:3970-4665(+)